MTEIADLELDYTLSTYEGWRSLVSSSRMERPDVLTSAAIAALSRRDTLLYNEARAVWHANLGPILTPGMLQVIDGLENLVGANRQHGTKVRSAALLDAYPGLGKTTLATHFGEMFHRRQIDLYGSTTSEGHERIPVAYVTLSSNTTMRSLNSMLCHFYAHPAADTGSATELAKRASACARKVGTRLIIIDDVHFLDMARKDGRAVVNHFKHLQTEFQATFLFVGVGIDEHGLLTEGLGMGNAKKAQTARRWTRYTMRPFEVDDDAGRAMWRKLLLAIERDLVLANKVPGMVADELANYLYARSTGHFASLMTLIARGCHHAIKTGEERLTTHLLDHISNDVEAERARKRIEDMLTAGRLTARPQR
jgi:hypothetical protein